MSKFTLGSMSKRPRATPQRPSTSDEITLRATVLLGIPLRPRKPNTRIQTVGRGGRITALKLDGAIPSRGT